MKRADRQPYSEMCLYGGIFIKTYVVPDRGTLLPQHSHHYAHVSFVVSGAVRVWCDDELMGDFLAPTTVKIAAYAKHKFLTLTDRVVMSCIHNADHFENGEPAVAAEHHLELED